MFYTGRINSTQSLFTYIPGQSADTFNDPSFAPVLELSDLPFSNMAGVEEVCGDSLECLFDVGATGDLEVGRAAVETQIAYSKTVKVSQPCKYWYCVHFQTKSISTPSNLQVYSPSDLRND